MLVVVIGVFVALTAAVLVWIPPSEANDEPDHVQNVVTLARGDWYLIEPGTGTEVNQPPAYYIALAAWHRALGLEPKVPAPPNRGLAALAEPGGVFWHNYQGTTMTSGRSDYFAFRVSLVASPRSSSRMPALVA